MTATVLRRYMTLCEGVTGNYTGTGALWHGTDLLGLASILASDQLDKSIDTDNPAGASLTYDEKMAWDFADRASYIFQNNHYHDLSSSKWHALGDDWPHGDPPLTGGVLAFATDRLRQQYKLVLYRDDEQDDEKEVRVLGDRIEPVSRFLVGFRFVPSDAAWYAAYLRLPHVRSDWHDPDKLADFLLKLHQHPLFRPA